MRPYSARPSRPRKSIPPRVKKTPVVIPARIHAILARKAPTAVIFRRGPSNQACTIGWNLENDTFTPGQWLHGKIYEYRSDLSPDGKYLLYFAADFRRSDKYEALREQFREQEFGKDPEPDLAEAPEQMLERINETMAAMENPDEHPEAAAELAAKFEIRMSQLKTVDEKYAKELAAFSGSAEDGAPSWTAVSLAPYLKAVDLWFNGSAWNGGGLFMDGKRIWLNNRADQPQRCARNDAPFETESAFPFEVNYGGECPGVYCHRLERDGWVEKRQTETSIVYEKKMDFDWALQKLFVSGHPGNGYGCYWERHRIVNEKRQLKVDGGIWRWADYDAPRKRIVYAKNGMLFALPVTPDFGTPVLLHNFNGMKFEAVPAPY